MKNIYIKNEAKKDFNSWTKQGLEFLLHYSNLSKKIKLQIQSKLKGKK